MYMLAAGILGALAVAVAVHLLFHWLMFEPPEEDIQVSPADSARFYDSRSWLAFRCFFEEKPLRLGYRRDKRGRFRKMP